MKERTTADIKFSVEKARRAQTLIAQKVIAEDQLPAKINQVAGSDVAYLGEFAVGVASLLAYDSLEVLENQTAVVKTKMPYISTLFAFRELPAAVASIRKLKHHPDVLLVDGHGKAHPYKCGLACHLGVALNIPTIGVAKTRLIGEPKQIGEETFLVSDGEIIGAELITIKNAKPIYVSVGHRVSLKTAINIVKHCLRHNRIPEPIRVAHRLASEERKAKILLPS